MKLLDIKHLGMGFEKRDGFYQIVEDVNLQISPGKTLALIGESGSGKTMTAYSIMGLVPSTIRFLKNSEIKLGQDNILNFSELDLQKIRGRRIAMIFQEPMTSLNPVMTIGAQIEEVLKKHFKLSHKRRQQRVIELLKAVQIAEPEQRMVTFPHQLSGGMKQRVMIAMALAGEPELLIADEPTTALDVTIQAQILELLRELQQKYHMAILLISHNLGVVLQNSEKIAVMYAGQIVEYADSKTLFKSPLHPYTQQLFEAHPSLAKRGKPLAVMKNVPFENINRNACCFAPRCPLAWDLCYQKAPRFILQGDQFVRCHLYEKEFEEKRRALPQEDAIAHEKRSKKDSMILEVKNLKVYFPITKGLLKRTVGYVQAVDDISFQISQGKTLALVGESGCGKTTAARAILRLLPMTSGEVILENTSLASLSDAEIRKRRNEFQIIFQDPFSSMNPRMMIQDILAEGLKSLKILKNPKEISDRIDYLLSDVGLPPEVKYRYPHEFSGGQRQRICIARALAVNPKLIVLDEPTSALDVSVQAQILNLLKKLQLQHGISYLFITHDISVVSYIADEVAVMYKGKIVEQGSVESILLNPTQTYTQKLLVAVPSFNHAEII